MITYRRRKKSILALLLAFPIGAIFLLLIFGSSGIVNPSLQLDYIPTYNKPIKNLLQYVTKQSLTKDRTYQIHIWMHGKRMERRFLRSYGKNWRDPYASCSVNNCFLTTRDNEYQSADAVLFHLHQTKGPDQLPQFHPSGQYWIFFTDESPYNTFYATRKYTMKDYNNIFNWSMTYRRDSDIPVPYGRTILLPLENSQTKLTDFAKSKNLTIAVLGSNCGDSGNHRWKYIKELNKHLHVDIYGNCGKLKCPGHFTKDCQLINKYKFYLAFENSNCHEYMTEKLWWNAYEKESVPIVMGASKQDYEDLCPPHSFIYAEDFDSPKKLSKYIEYLNSNDTAYNEYFKWKTKFKVLNEHGYFGSPSLHLCRICEKLNKKNQPKIYTNLESFWNSKKDCKKSSWSS